MMTVVDIPTRLSGQLLNVEVSESDLFEMMSAGYDLASNEIEDIDVDLGDDYKVTVTPPGYLKQYSTILIGEFCQLTMRRYFRKQTANREQEGPFIELQVHCFLHDSKEISSQSHPIRYTASINGCSIYVDPEELKEFGLSLARIADQMID